MISRTFHSYKFCKSERKFTIKEHLFTSGHKSPRHIHDMRVGTASYPLMLTNVDYTWEWTNLRNDFFKP